MTVTNVAPITLFEPVTGLLLRAESYSTYNYGDENIVISFHKIYVLPEEFVKASRSFLGKGFIVTNGKSDDIALVKWSFQDGLRMAEDDRPPVLMVQITSDMTMTGQGYNAEGTMRHCYIYDGLGAKIIRSPMQMAELIETENIKLLEES